MGDILASNFAIRDYGISLGNNQYQLEYGSLSLYQPTPMAVSGTYKISIQILSIVGFDNELPNGASIEISDSTGAAISIGKTVYINENNALVTLTGTYTIPLDESRSGYTNLGIKVYCPITGAQVEIYNGTYTIVSKTVVLPLMGGGKVVIPIVTPDIGDKCVVIPIQGGGNAVKKLVSPQKGDKVVVLPLRGGGKVVIPLTIKKAYIGFAFSTFSETPTVYCDDPSFTYSPTIPMSNAMVGRLDSAFRYSGICTFLFEDGVGNQWDGAFEFKLNQVSREIEIWGYSPYYHQYFNRLFIYNKFTAAWEQICAGESTMLPDPYHEIAEYSKYVFLESEYDPSLHLLDITQFV